jgi:ElaB/YqjD/DUF883 family membrane-anchored ribosome-binding protein
MVQESDLVRAEINETREQLTEKLGTLEDRIREQVENVKTRADETIDRVRSTLYDMNPKHRIERNPLFSLGVAFAAGLATGHLVGGRGRERENGRERGVSHLSATERPYFPLPKKPSFVERMGEYFEPELSIVKGMVVAGIADSVRNLIKEPLPRYAPEIDKLVDSVKGRFTADTHGTGRTR